MRSIRSTATVYRVVGFRATQPLIGTINLLTVTDSYAERARVVTETAEHW